MARSRGTDVLVVGAGPVGLFGALALADAGFGVEIVDEERRPAVHSYALALHPRSLDLLEHLGVAGDLVDRGQQIETLAFYEGGQRRASLPLTASPAFPFVLSVPQSVLEAVLEEALAARGVAVQWNHRLARLEDDGGSTVAMIEELEQVAGGYAIAGAARMVRRSFSLQPRFVLGADGHGSSVRRYLGVDWPSTAPAELYGVFEVAANEPVAAELAVVLGDGTVSALWPLPDGRVRWSFQLPDPERVLGPEGRARKVVQIGRRAFPQIAEESLGSLLAERAPWFPDVLGEVYWSVAVRFERRLAASFGNGNVWLAGDAAHLTGPVGAQSMNVGLLEAYETVEQLSAAGAGAGSLPSSRNDALRDRWRPLLGTAGGPEATPEAADWVVRNRDRIVACLPASGAELSALAARIGLQPRA